MENTLHTPVSSSGSGGQMLPLIVAAVLSLLCYLTYDCAQQTQKERVNMEKSSGRNEKHSNPKARQSAEEQFEKVKQEFDKLSSKTNKTKEEVKQWNKLKKQLEHWRRKKNWKGEHHSQKHKGN